jgi:hypothetical protein
MPRRQQGVLRIRPGTPVTERAQEGLFMKRLAIFAALGAAGTFALVPLATSQAATATPAATTASASYATTVSHATRTAYSATGVKGFPHVAASTLIESASKAPRALTSIKSPAGADPAAGATGSGAATVTRQATAKTKTSVVHAFDGLNDLTNDQLYGALTPPDQGLCVGPDHTVAGVPDAVWEIVNSIAEEYTKSGSAIYGPVNSPTLFQDPYAFSDPRCLFDPSTQSFYFTLISFPIATGPNSTETNTVDDLLVINSKGAATYQFDSSLGGQCLGDQPKTGFDNNAIVISTDEYCGPTLSNYEGAIIDLISKSQVVSEASTVNYGVLGPVGLSGDPVVGLDPAINTGTGTAYFLNSVPFLANGNNNPVGDTLGLWSLTNTESITTGKGSPTLSSTAISSEPYAFPVPAPSTGNGSTKTYNGSTITSEATLNPDDSRLSAPVNVTPASGGGVNLWTALDTALASSGAPTTDGAAWFEVSTAKKKVTSQGYVAAQGASLLYPAVYVSKKGTGDVVYTITSPQINPSPAYNVLGKSGITIVANGSGPHWSFSDAAPFFEPRWGDYSWAVNDPESGEIWLATEYIPPVSEWDGYDNWGTYLFAVNNG